MLSCVILLAPRLRAADPSALLRRFLGPGRAVPERTDQGSRPVVQSARRRQQSGLARHALNLLAPKFIVLYVFVVSAMYVHYRGRVRHGFLRQLTDHSSLMAPYNALMYLFSATTSGW
jgi:hypothetical protein